MKSIIGIGGIIFIAVLLLPTLITLNLTPQHCLSACGRVGICSGATARAGFSAR
jgi:hypothetical protein